MAKKVKGKRKATKRKMVNITINIPENYDENIQKLIKKKIIPSRSEGIRIALREFLQKEYSETLKIFNFIGNEDKKSEKMPSGRKLGEPNLETKISELKTEIKGKDNMINYLKAELDKHEKRGLKNEK